LALAMIVQLSYAAFTGNSSDGSKDKFSLKNLHTIKKAYTLAPMNTKNYQLISSQQLQQKNTGGMLQVQSLVRLQKGNTTYVYPYKYVVKVPKFKTPTQPIR
ncbi:MAG TPA: hypothetical protein PL045_10900, partial [Chitinophagaceae bacterium]|nr:hypothetical protein [Chitinophagaceae bacterium]